MELIALPHRFAAACIVYLLATSTIAMSIAPVARAQSEPPKARIRPVTVDYFGTKFVDNYRHLENLKDPEVQLDESASGLRAFRARRSALFAQIEELMRVQSARVSDIQNVVGHYYSLRIPLGGQTAGLYVRDGLNGTDRLLIDPEKRSDSRGMHSSLYSVGEVGGPMKRVVTIHGTRIVDGKRPSM
jgi:prolyl oligopeptidase